MENIISKELLSEVLGYDNIKGIFEDSEYTFDLLDEEMKDSERLIVFDTVGYRSYLRINIHELAHKCKKWACRAVLDGYYITSFIDNNYAQCTIIANHKTVETCTIVFEADTEPEAVFKACQWILENKK